MARKKKKEKILNFNSDDFRWCIENDFQVYPVVNSFTGKYHIAIRRNGISCEGKDWHTTKEGIIITSKERMGSREFRNMNEVSLHLPSVYKQLRELYGQANRTNDKPRKKGKRGI